MNSQSIHDLIFVLTINQTEDRFKNLARHIFDYQIDISFKETARSNNICMKWKIKDAVGLSRRYFSKEDFKKLKFELRRLKLLFLFN